MSDSQRTTLYIDTYIDRPAAEVHQFALDPANLPQWAAGLTGSIDFIDGQWIAESPMGRIRVVIVEDNHFGVLDHWVTLPNGETIYNPVRAIPHGDGCEVVFTLRRADGVTDAEFDADARAVAADLATLKTLLESR